MLFLHFLLIIRNYIFLDSCNFLVDADQNAKFSLSTYFRLTQFSYTEISNFPDDFIPLNEICNFDALILATFMTFYVFD